MEKQQEIEFTHWQILIIWALLGGLTFWLVQFFASRQTHWYIYCTTFVGWLFPISTVLLLPLDLSSSLYRQCVFPASSGNGTVIRSGVEPVCDAPFLVASQEFLLYSWRAIYWSMFMLSYFANPFLAAYVDSGYFTVLERTKKAIRANLIYYGIIGILGAAGILYAVVLRQLDMATLMDIAMTLANLFGLLLVICFLAFGLIQVPRDCWNAGNYKRQLRALEFKAPKVKDELNDAEAEYYDLAKEIYGISNNASLDEELRPFVKVIVDKCPLGKSVGDLGPVSAEYRQVDMVKLAKLHKEIKRAGDKKRRFEWEWNNLCLSSFHYQDLLTLKDDLERKYTPSFRFAKNDENSAGELEIAPTDYIPSKRWIWYCRTQPVFFKVLAVVLGVMSAVVIWASTTYVIPPPTRISIIGNIYHSDNVSYAFIEWVTAGFLVYNTICCLHTLFRVRIFNMFSLHPYHHTAETSLTWFTGQMTRLTFPLCYNFIYMADSKDVSLFDLMGTMKGEQFIQWLPLVLIMLVICNVFDLFSRCMRCCGFSDDFMSSESGATWDNVEDGKLIFSEVRSNMERKADRVSRTGASTGLLSEYGSPGKDDRLLQNPSKSPPKAAAETSWTAPRKGKDLSQTTSKYLLNNPLYEKYQKKFSGVADEPSSSQAESHSTIDRERESLFSSKPVSTYKSTHKEEPNAPISRDKRTPSPDKGAVKPASRFSGLVGAIGGNSKRDDTRLLDDDSTANEWASVRKEAQDSSKSGRAGGKIFEDMW